MAVRAWKALLVLLCAGVHVPSALAQAPADPDEPTFTWRYSLKSSALLSRAADDSTLVPDRNSATGFWRFRLEPTVRLGDQATFELAFEQRLRVFSSETSPVGAGVLPTGSAAPFRIRSLDWSLSSAANAEWRGEIDRAAVRVQLPRSNFVVGRQPVGWGRGVLFSAVDLFSPFTPLEADREWRRGVDAVRADVKLADRVSVDVVGAFGDRVDRSTFAGRVRGYAGRADLEVMAGRRARDFFGGVTSSAALGNMEVHGELAAFRTPADPGSAAFADERSVVKAVIGGSYRFALGTGLLVYAEYHYSGFGAPSARAILQQLQEPAFQERYARGDTQILGRHAAAALASYELSPEAALSTEWLQSPVDGSGVVVPSATLTLGDRWSIVLSGYVPYGRSPAGPVLESEFGAAPLAAFVQLKVYR